MCLIISNRNGSYLGGLNAVTDICLRSVQIMGTALKFLSSSQTSTKESATQNALERPHQAEPHSTSI